MSIHDKPVGTLRIWWTFLRYPTETFVWWSYRFYSKYIKEYIILGTCNVSEVTDVICNKIASGYNALSRLRSQGRCSYELSPLRKIERYNQAKAAKALIETQPEGNRLSFVHIIDSAKDNLRLGAVFARDYLKHLSNLIKEHKHYLEYQADLIAYRLKEKTKANIDIIIRFFDKILDGKFTELKQKAKDVYTVSKSQAAKGFYIASDSTKKGFYVSIENARKGYTVTVGNAKNAFHDSYSKSRNAFNSNINNTVLTFSDTVEAFVSWAVNLINLVKMSVLGVVGSAVQSPMLQYYIIIILSLCYIIYQIVRTYQGELYYRNLIREQNKVREGCKSLILEDVTLKEVMKRLLEQIHLGLNHKTRDKASVKCYNTYVQDLPTGNEKGKFLALDLGGTNFRVLLIKLDGRHYEMQSKIYAISQTIMTGPGSELFDHIANCLDNFTKEHKINNEKLGLGFTFSFPLMQKGLDSGILTRWTKGFNCAGVIGQDVVVLLKEAIQKKMQDRINIVAVLNDTTGTLMSCAWKNHNCKIGLILGTGTNACFVEKIENVENFDGNKQKPHVIINLEWGAFGDLGELEFIRTSHDIEIDKSSVNAGRQIFEKMISGMYLGEIVRRLIVKFVNEKILFEGKSSDILLTREKFLTEYVSDIESDNRGSFKNCKNVLEKVGIQNATELDCANVRYICECASRRAAHLASAGLAVLLNKMQEKSVTVGVDGTLYRKHPYFHDIMVEKIAELVDPTIQTFSLMLSNDGSGRGAALVAATAMENK